MNEQKSPRGLFCEENRETVGSAALGGHVKMSIYFCYIELTLSKKNKMAVKVATEDNFEETVLSNEKLAVVHFKADWCGPCKIMVHILEKFSEEYQGRVDILSLDVDANENIAMRYGLSTIPTFIIFKNGRWDEQLRGPMSRSQLRDKIEWHLI